MKESASATRRPAKICGSAPGSDDAAEHLGVARAHVARRPDEDARRGARAVVGVDERRIEAGEGDDQDLGEIADAEPQHEHRQHDDLRHGVGEEDERAQHLVEAAGNARRETEHDAQGDTDGEAGQRAHQARGRIRVELARAERGDELLRDLERRQHEIRCTAHRRPLPEEQHGGPEGDAPEAAGHPLGRRRVAVPARHEEIHRQLGADIALAGYVQRALADGGELVAHAAVVVVVRDLPG